MKIPSTMRQIVYDTQPLNPQGATTFLADNGTVSTQSATEWPEEQLVTWLFSRPRVRAMICEELGLPEQACYRTEVRAPFVQDSNRKPGDIDLLLVGPEQPQAAVAVETKRVKVRPGRDGVQVINKLPDFIKGMRQASGLLNLGFSRAYMAMLAVVDARDETDSGFMFRGMQPAGMRYVVETPDWDLLRSEVGMLYVEVVQPVNRSIDEAAIIRLAILRAAQPQEQSVETTSGIIRFFGLPS